MISVAFPNLFQQAVLPFQLADPHETGTSEGSGAVSGQPGRSSVVDSKCAAVAEGVVDERSVKSGWFGKLPPEIAQAMLDEVGFPITLEEAELLRKELTDECSDMSAVVDELLKDDTWSF